MTTLRTVAWRSLAAAALAAGLTPVLAHTVLARSAAAATAPGGTVQPGFSTPVELPGSTGFGEPSLAIDPAGRMYVTAPSGIGSLTSSPVWHSYDGGASWTEVSPGDIGPEPGPLAGGDADLAIDSAGDVFQTDLWLGSSAMSVSTDHGSTWTGNEVGHVPTGDDRPWLAYSPSDQNLYLAYDGFAGIMVDRTSLATPAGADGGLVFPQHVVAVPECLLGGSNPCDTPPIRQCACPPGGMAVDPTSGEVFLTFSRQNGTGLGGGIGVATSTNQGVTWSQTSIPGTGSTGSAFDTEWNFAPVKVDSAGNVYVAWGELVGGSVQIRLAVSEDHGATWSSPVTVSTTTGTNVFPTLAVLSPGVVAVGYYGTTATGDPNSVPAATQWNLYVATSTNALSSARSFTPSEAVADIHEGTIQASNGSGDRSLLDFFQLAFDPQGLVHVAYAANPGGSATNLFVTATTASLAAAPTRSCKPGHRRPCRAPQSGSRGAVPASPTGGRTTTGARRAAGVGGRHPAAVARSTRAVSASRGIGFRAPVKLTPTGGGGYEPAVVTGPFGDIFVTAHKENAEDALAPDTNAPTGVRTASWVWVSVNGGRSFADIPDLPGDVQKHWFGDEGDLALDGHRNLYFVDTNVGDVSFDKWTISGPGLKGIHLDTTRPILPSAQPVDDRPWITAHGNGDVFYLGNEGDKVTYPLGQGSGTGKGAGRYTVYASYNGGSSFNTFGETLADSGWCRPAADPRSSYVYVICTNDGGSNGLTSGTNPVGNLYAYVSADNGKTFSRYRMGTYHALDSTTSWPTVAVAPDGSIWALYVDATKVDSSGNPKGNDLLLFHSTDHGRAWQETNITPKPGRYHYSWLSASPDGRYLGVGLYYRPNDSSAWHVFGAIWRPGQIPVLTSIDPTHPVAPADREAPGDLLGSSFNADDSLDVVWTRDVVTAPQATLFRDIYFARSLRPN